MSRQLTILNAANVYSVNFLRHIRGYNRIVLGDIYNHRNHVS